MLGWSDSVERERRETGPVRTVLLAALIALGLALAAVGVIAAGDGNAGGRGGALFRARHTSPGTGDDRDCPARERNDAAPADQVL